MYDVPHIESVSSLARYAAKWSVILTVVRQIMAVGTTMIIARHITPSDFGIAMMVVGFVAFLVLFDTGLTWATVQSPQLTKNKVDSLFFVGIVLGTVLCFSAVLAGPFMAQFYGQPQLITITPVMGAAIFLNSLATQPTALLKRQLRQREINIAETAALLLSSVMAVLFALSGAGYWALIMQVVTYHVVRTPLMFIFSGYRPGLISNLSIAGQEIKLAASLALSNCICYFQLYLGGIIVGYYFGAFALGNYQRAYGVKSLPTTYGTMVLTDVMVSSLAALYSDRQRMGEAYLKALRLSAFLVCPAGAALMPMSDEIILIMYGGQYSAVPPMLEWFAIAAIALPISTSTIWLFLASENAAQQLRMNLLLTAISVASLILAAQLGYSAITIVAIESILFAGPYLLINLVMSHRAVGLPLLNTFRVVMPIIAGSVISAGLAWFVGQGMVEFDWWLIFCIKILVGGSTYIAFCIIFVDEVPFKMPKLRQYLNKAKRAD